MEDVSCYHITRHGSLSATARTLEDAVYAVRTMARESAEFELAERYRNGELPVRSFLATRTLELEAEYDITGPHREAACAV